MDPVHSSHRSKSNRSSEGQIAYMNQFNRKFNPRFNSDLHFDIKGHEIFNLIHVKNGEHIDFNIFPINRNKSVKFILQIFKLIFCKLDFLNYSPFAQS